MGKTGAVLLGLGFGGSSILLLLRNTDDFANELKKVV